MKSVIGEYQVSLAQHINMQFKINKRHKHFNTNILLDFIFSCCYTLSIFLNAIQVGLLGYEFIEIFGPEHLKKFKGVNSSKFSGGTSNSSPPNDVSKTGRDTLRQR